MTNEKLERINTILLYIMLFSLIVSNIVLTVTINELKKKVKNQDEINEYIFNRIEGYNE